MGWPWGSTTACSSSPRYREERYAGSRSTTRSRSQGPRQQGRAVLGLGVRGGAAGHAARAGHGAAQPAIGAVLRHRDRGQRPDPAARDCRSSATASNGCASRSCPRQHGGESRSGARRRAGTRTALTAGATTAVLLALALPVLTLETGSAGLTSLPEDRSGAGLRRARDLLPQVRGATRPRSWSTRTLEAEVRDAASACAARSPATGPSARRRCRPRPTDTSPWSRSRYRRHGGSRPGGDRAPA